MERQFIDPAELELRRDFDFLRSENMVDEGAPVYGEINEYEVLMKKLELIEKNLGFEVPSIPKSCEL